MELYNPNPFVVDFNGDGIVDIKDLLTLIESWGQDDPAVDIAPLPYGDGIVDALDLELLMSYWEQSIDDPTLVAHWALSCDVHSTHQLLYVIGGEPTENEGSAWIPISVVEAYDLATDSWTKKADIIRFFL